MQTDLDQSKARSQESQVGQKKTEASARSILVTRRNLSKLKMKPMIFEAYSFTFIIVQS